MKLDNSAAGAALKQPELGLLIIRASVGIILMLAGWNKATAGTEVLQKVGANIRHIGIDVGSEGAIALFFGIAAAGGELLGGLLLLVGFLFRPASLLLAFTMLVATLTKYSATSGDFTQYGYPLIVLLVLIGLLFTGPGKLSIQKD